MKDFQKPKIKRRFYRKKVKPQKLKKSGVIFSGEKKPASLVHLFVIPLVLFSLFLALYLLNFKISQSIKISNIASRVDTSLSPYPLVLNSYTPTVGSKAAIVIDADSKKIVYSKNPTLRFSMASTVKIMTSIIALDYFKSDSVLTIKTDQVEGSGLNLQIGNRFYFEDLLYAMLLPSANDAAFAIAENYPGGVEEFVMKMNQKAKELRLNDTHFEDPIGLDDDKNFTTVIDLSRLASIAIKNTEFAHIVSTQQKFITDIDQTEEYNLQNLNKLLGAYGVNGIKTGTTEGAGEVLVTSALINGHTFIIIVMNSQNRFVDTQTLLSYIYQNVQFTQLPEKSIRL